MQTPMKQMRQKETVVDSKDKAKMEEDMQDVRNRAYQLKKSVLAIKEKWDVSMWDEMIVYLIESKESAKK